MPGEVVVVHAQHELPEWWDAAVFLAGPTPRDPAVASWRPDAVDLLRQRWRGPGRLVVFVPEAPGGGMTGTWSAQVAWEDRCLSTCDVIAFWVPRDMATLPGLTTNVEWGRWEASGRAVLGTPPAATATRYLRHYATANRVPVCDTLDETVAAALDAIGSGGHREGGAREVPLPIWRTDVFQRWYRTQRDAGNTLLAARPLWVFRVGGDVFFWALWVAVHIGAEDRIKDIEVVLARPDVVTVVLYRSAAGAALDETSVVLVREFRSPCCAVDGYVRELPGGGIPEPGGDPLQQAIAEVSEETGLAIPAERFRAHGSRQVLATMSAHRAHLYSVELTGEELDRLRADAGTVHGVAADGERTYVEVVTYRALLRDRTVDRATLGAVAEALAGPA